MNGKCKPIDYNTWEKDDFEAALEKDCDAHEYLLK